MLRRGPWATTAISASVTSVRVKRGAIVVAVMGLLTGCATPGETPASPRSVTVVVSAADPGSPAVAPPMTPDPAQSDRASCAWGAKPMPSVDPSASFDMSDPQERARRVLAEQYRPTPRRGVVAAAAVPGAEACVRALRIEFSLLTAGSPAAPDDPAIERALRSAGLTKIVIRSGPVWAASTGGACVYGTFTAAGPAFTIGPPAIDGSCRP